MHTIDLLRGQGIPPKTTFGSIAIFIVMAAVPLLVAAGLLDKYLQNREAIAIQQKKVANNQAMIDEFAGDVKFKETMGKKASTIGSELSEVASCIGDYAQWSPVLETLARNMPAKMVMSGLSAQSKIEKKRVAKNGSPGQSTNITVTKRTLFLDISGNLPGTYETVVRNYRDRLNSSALLGPKLEEITVSKKPGATGDDETVSWTMALVFKSEL